MAYEMSMERLFDAPPEVVFDAYVDQEVQQEMWAGMMPGTRVRESSIDLRVGGTWTVEYAPVDGKSDVLTNVLTVVERPTRLVSHQSYFAAAWGVTKETDTTLTFEDQDGKTLLKILMTGFDTEQEQGGASAGWAPMLDGFQKILESRIGGNA
jgi:uncharacterized protein YndB with AHSA1/START domain